MFKGRKVRYVDVFARGGFIAVSECGKVKQFGDMRGNVVRLEGAAGAEWLEAEVAAQDQYEELAAMIGE